MKKKKLGYLGQQLLGYSIVLLIIVIILFNWVYYYMVDFSMTNMAVMQSQVTTSATEHVNNYFDQLMLIGDQVAQDEDVIAIMTQLQNEVNNPETNWFWKDGRWKTSSRLYRLLVSHNFADDPAWRISVYNDLGDFVCAGASVDEDVSAALSPDGHLFQLLNPVLGARRNHFLITGPMEDPFSESNGSYISLIQPILDAEGQICGYVDVQKSTQSLFDLLDLDVQTGMDAYLFTQLKLNGQQDQVYPPDKTYPEHLTPTLHLHTGETDYGWVIRVLLDQEVLFTPYRYILFTMLAVASSLFILMFLGIILVARNTSRPILKLSDKIRKATLDDPADRQSIGQATDEVKALEQSFDIMMQRIKTSVELEKKAYLKALQSQMNPHFLYNSLFAISSMAMELDDRTIPKFCDHLAAILRYETAYGDNLVTLREESKYVRDYLELMKLRFEEDFDYHMEADEALMTLSLPRLTLQPILENCFEHAFNAVPPPWHIDLRIFREADRWIIIVADNGSGFQTEQISRLHRQIEAMSHNPGTHSDLEVGGLGLANTILRLRLALDDAIEYTIDPKLPTGTIVTLKGPINQ